ncbi:MAG: UDP-3-O-(3-hydroxymyristoyl)glucosamine N-acyltransferase [Ignavibacteria bacterium]|nr:UDP-3-O-(3-hydroxymyristoyl)glucosamine N-acyltransferase [Ignavibacteria bacterium]
MRISDIAAWFNGDVVGDGSTEITRVAKIEEAGPNEITFLANPKYEKFLAQTTASAVLVARSVDRSRLPARANLAFVLVDDPYLAFLTVLKRLTPVVDPLPHGIHSTAVVAPTAKIGKNVSLGAYVVVGEGASVGNETRIGHGSVIGPYAEIGEQCSLHANVVVYQQCRLANRVVIHSGTVVGSDGFGFAPKPDGTYEKIPQLGIVVIEDDVEIGSNCSIDRATIGETVIKRGVKLDNLIQVAHNVTIGENTVLAAQVGISGSTKIGSQNKIGGQVGIAGHLEIADDTTMLAQSGISKSVKEKGKVLFGYPAKEQGKAARIEAALRSLPELILEVRSLHEEIARLKNRLEKNGTESK